MLCGKDTGSSAAMPSMEDSPGAFGLGASLAMSQVLLGLGRQSLYSSYFFGGC